MIIKYFKKVASLFKTDLLTVSNDAILLLELFDKHVPLVGQLVGNGEEIHLSININPLLFGLIFVSIYYKNKE